MKYSEIEYELEQEIQRVKLLVGKRRPKNAEDFNIRGELYRLAGLIAPDARNNDITHMRRWLKPAKGEKGLDIAAGSGFLTLRLARWTQTQTYAVDTSTVQLRALQQSIGDLPITTIEGSLADSTTVAAFGDDVGKIDFVTSFAGLHHIVDFANGRGRPRNNQQLLFRNVDTLLRPGGRFIAADVGGGTILAKHFEQSVKSHCLTGHEEKWLTPERLEGELIEGTSLKFIKARLVPVGMIFDSTRHMALFMKGLHAYDLPNDAIVADLMSILGFKEEGRKIHLNWPLLFFHLQKHDTVTS
jgi:SAM-dependent methyltransferase